MVHHRPERPSPSSPAVPPLPPAFTSFQQPWRTGRWQGSSCSEHARAPACRSGGTVGGGGFPTTKIPQYPGHTGGKIVPAPASSFPSATDIPQPGSSAPPLRSGSPSCTSAVYFSESVAAQLCIPSATLPFCVCIFSDSDPSAISSPHSLHWSRPL